MPTKKKPAPSTPESDRKAKIDEILLQLPGVVGKKLNHLDAYFVSDRMFACLSGALETVTLAIEVPDRLRQRTKRVRWRWRALVLPKGGNECRDGYGDSAAVVYISYANELRRDGLSIADATREAAILRLRPIMMTALVAALGLLPAALSHGIGSDTQRPFALAERKSALTVPGRGSAATGSAIDYPR